MGHQLKAVSVGVENVSAKDRKIRVIITSSDADDATGYVRLAFDGSDPGFKEIAVPAFATRYLDFDLPAEWAKAPGTRAVLVQITMEDPTAPPKKAAKGAAAKKIAVPEDLAEQLFRIEVNQMKVKP